MNDRKIVTVAQELDGLAKGNSLSYNCDHPGGFMARLVHIHSYPGSDRVVFIYLSDKAHSLAVEYL